MQTQNRLFDDLARVAGGALGALTGVRDEIEGIIRYRLERVLAEMDLVTREEFEAVRAMAAEARAENEALAARIAELEEAAKRKPSVRPTSSAASVNATRRVKAHRNAAGVKAVKPKGEAAAGPTAAAAEPPPDASPEGEGPEKGE
ncbi:accessory factor UbiK family protein [Caenispirillum bisanense]|uniref:accessory factor UbiK family protein n=1 Tax=Caenispirillum bisanense TaxID=414052 RepID=UPI0031DE8360